MYLFISMVAVVFLPRQFQVAVVENVNEDHLEKAIWLFPLYLFAINIFVLPIAFGGLLYFSVLRVDADFFALVFPMTENREILALFVFIGGTSAATGMVIVETIALSTMISNELVMPILLRSSVSRLTYRKDFSAEMKLQDGIAALESTAHQLGFYRALGLCVGGCKLCETCTPKGEPCRHPFKARPSPEGFGIDITELAKEVGVDVEWPPKQHVNFMGLLLV